jgi:cysteine desulfuration protein SufE
MFQSCLDKQNAIKQLFASCKSKEETYQKIIEIGQASPPLLAQYKIPENEVPGCQSIMHMHASERDGKIYFEAESEALISCGLAALLTRVYSGEDAETIIKCPPDYLEEIGVSSSLSPNRANGLYSIHLKMKQIALQSLIKHSQ